MGLMDKLKKNTTPQPAATPAPAAAPAAPAQHSGGTINLAKGQGIKLAKTQVMTAVCSWPPATDYDVYALVRYRNGRTETVSTFGTKQDSRFQVSTQDGAVRHLGDVQRSADAMASETIEIRLTPDVVAVVPVVYSAQSNGAGSFRRYRVGMSIDNGQGQKVVIDASNASDHDNIYTCVPGIILNSDQGVQVNALELYSRRGSENRPDITPDLSVVMDAGPVNAYK
jgi:tellurite resistance protein TerA